MRFAVIVILLVAILAALAGPQIYKAYQRRELVARARAAVDHLAQVRRQAAVYRHRDYGNLIYAPIKPRDGFDSFGIFVPGKPSRYFYDVEREAQESIKDAMDIAGPHSPEMRRLVVAFNDLDDQSGLGASVLDCTMTAPHKYARFEQ